MREKVEVQSADFDPSKDYSGSYSDEYLYYFDGGSRYTIKKSVIECEDVFDKLDALGKTSPYKMAYWYSSRWNSFEYDNVNYSRTVCQADGNTEVSWGGISAEEFYSGNYLNWYYNHRETTYTTRLDIVKQVSKSLADGLEGVNIGLMAFDKYGTNYGEGALCLRPFGRLQMVGKTSKSVLTALGRIPIRLCRKRCLAPSATFREVTVSQPCLPPS